MGIAKHSRSTNVNWGIDTKNLEFKKLKELKADTVYPMLGCFVTKDNGYGEGAVIITEGALVNIPARYIDDIREIVADAEAVNDIRTGHAGFTYSTFISEKFHREGYLVDFVER